MLPQIDTSLAETLRHVRSQGGTARLTDWGILEISGADAASFLQSQTTNDVLALSIGQGHLTALLDRKAHINAVLSLHRLGADRFWLVAEAPQMPTILARLEQYHFSEKLTMADFSPQVAIFTAQGPKVWQTLKTVLSPEPNPLSEGGITGEIHLNTIPVTLIKRSLTGEDGYLMVTAVDQTEVLDKILGSLPDLIAMTSEALNILRVEAGIPQYGVDMDAGMMLPSTGLQHTTVSYTKGCYLGQEVVAKVRTHGSIQKGLVGLVFSDITTPLPCPAVCQLNGEEIGHITSSVYSPTLQAVIAIAYLNRENRVPEKLLHLTIAAQSCSARVAMLPFYTPANTQEQARRLYNTAVNQFAHNAEAEAITHLREALELDPHLTDAYEALGVILSRHEQYEEAIALMEKWAELAPNEGMPHTNLSVFYMKIGMKEKAEDEKALATTLGFKKAMAEKMQQQTTEQARQAQLKALEDKVAMFQEVLELDAEDTLANYGLGNTYVSLERFEAALPHLEKALEGDPKYTVAYLALGKAWAGLGQTDKARSVYEQGITVAAQRGDLMPMNDMQSRLNNLS